jgi:hypothetical protein
MVLSYILLDPRRYERRHLARNLRLPHRLVISPYHFFSNQTLIQHLFVKSRLFIVNASVLAWDTGVLCMALAPTR